MSAQGPRESFFPAAPWHCFGKRRAGRLDLPCQLKCTAHQKSEASQQKYARSRLQKKLVTGHCLPDSRGAMIQAGGTACVGTLIRSIDARAAASPLRVTRASSLRVRCARPAHGASPTLPPRAAGKADDLSECLIITVP